MPSTRSVSATSRSNRSARQHMSAKQHTEATPFKCKIPHTRALSTQTKRCGPHRGSPTGNAAWLVERQQFQQFDLEVFRLVGLLWMELVSGMSAQSCKACHRITNGNDWRARGDGSITMLGKYTRRAKLRRARGL